MFTLIRFWCKLLMGLTGAALIAIALLVLLFFSQSAPLARRLGERALGEALQAPVEIERVAAAPWRASLEVHGVTVYNPAGFGSGPAIRAGRVSVIFDPLTLFSRQPIIEEIRLIDTTVYLRHEAGRGTNIAALARSARPPGDAGQAPPPRRAFALKTVRGEAGKVVLSTNVIPAGRVGLNVAPFSLDGFEDGPPLKGGAVASVVLRSLVREMVSVKGLLPPVVNALQEELQHL